MPSLQRQVVHRPGQRAMIGRRYQPAVHVDSCRSELRILSRAVAKRMILAPE